MHGNMNVKFQWYACCGNGNEPVKSVTVLATIMLL
jgi:hypothetical protein